MGTRTVTPVNGNVPHLVATTQTQDLLQRLKACTVTFDPLYDHSDPRTPPRKVAFVPADLMAALIAGLERGLDALDTSGDDKQSD